MATQGVNKLHINKFWDDEYKRLDYILEPFNDPASLALWTTQGYTGPFTGYMCDMRSPQPSWNHRFLSIFEARGYSQIGTSYYRMDTNTILPVHKDLYKRYVELFNLHGQEKRIHRAIVFLEDWQSGHYFEIDSRSYTDWRAGDAVEWCYDTPHMAANIGLIPRYTLQITGLV